MPLKSLIYLLFNKEKRPLYQDEAGNIQEGDPGNYTKPDGELAKVEKSPEGWKDTVIKYFRNIKYWGLFRDHATTMKYVGDGYNILKNQMWTFGVEAVVYLGILRFDRYNLPYNYENFFLSELNFSKYNQTLTHITIEALEGGLSKVFKAKETTSYELGIETDAEHINIITDGREFDFTRTFEFIPEQKAIDVDNYFMGVVETAREGNPGLEIAFQEIYPKSSSVYPNEDWLARFGILQDIQLEGKVKIQYAQNITAIIRAEVNDGATPGGTTLINLYNQAGTAGQIKEALISQAITIPLGHRLHIKHFMFNPLNTGLHYTILSGELTVKYVYRFATTYTRALYPFRVIDQIVRQMGPEFNAVSTWLEAKKDIAITSADALRKIAGAGMKTTASDFYKSIQTLPGDDQGGGAGLGVEDDKLRIERFDHFFQDDEVLDLGEVKSPSVAVADDLFFNLIKVGQAPNEYQDANGRDETNQSQEWRAPITKIIRDLDLISKYRKDSLGVEQARINFENKKSTDNKYDTDLFFLNIETVPTPIEATVRFNAAGSYMMAPAGLNFSVGEAINISGTAGNNGAQSVVTITPDAEGQKIELSGPVVDEAAVLATLDFVDHPYFKLNRPAYTATTGIPHPESAFNTELSPKKALLSNGSMIRSVLDLMDASEIVFGTADKNKEQSTTLAGVTVTEKENIQVASLAERKWRPYYMNFTTKLPVNVLALIKAKPYGWVRFTIEGTEYKAFLFDGGFKPVTLDAQTWKTLSHKDNDLSKFGIP